MRGSSEARDRGEEQTERELGFDLPRPAQVSRGRAALFTLGASVLLAGAFLAVFIPKRRARRALEEGAATVSGALPRVEVARPTVLSSDRALVLPGTIRPLEEAIIRTRASGYVRERLVDLGDRVEAGALLVEIDTPELDRQLDQARAELARASAAVTHAKASHDFARTNLTRYEKLAPAGVSSQEELERARSQADVAEANVAVARANLDAESANVRRLTQEKAFARVVAPFAGTIVSRSVEKGALVSPASELFKLAMMDPMRVLVEVPQDVAPSVRADVPATVTVREYAGRAFEGKVARFAGALDPQSRTMTTDVRVPNPSGELLPGMYARVALSLPTPRRVLEVPATALVHDAHGTRVAIVAPDDTIRFAPILIDRDTGPTLQIATGIEESDRVVVIPGPQLVEGRRVEVAEGIAPDGGPR